MSHLFPGAHSEEVILGPGPRYAEEILKRRLQSENASNVSRSRYTTLGKFENAPNSGGHYGFVLEEDSRHKISCFSNSSCKKCGVDKLCFRDGLVWTVGLTVEIKLRFLG